MGYTTKRPTKGDFEDYLDVPYVPQLVVFEKEPEFIGLLNADGEPIWRVPDPIGFLWFEDEE